MKNKLIACGISLLTLFTLVACGTQNSSSSEETSSSSSESSSSSSSESSSGGSSSSSSQPATADWTNAQKSVMTSHLGGYVMPYIALNSDVTVLWYSDYQCVSIESANSAESKVVEYKNILVNAGFDFEYDEDYEAWYGYATTASYDILEVMIYYYSGFVCNIYFTEALTSWPTSQIEGFLGQGAVIPSVTAAAYYYLSYNEYYGYDIIVALEAADQYENYMTTLANAGWTVTDLDTSAFAQDSNEIAEITFYVDGTDLYIEIAPYSGNKSATWPADAINDFFSTIEDASDLIPEFTGANLYTFGVEEWEISDEVTLKPWFYITMSEDSFTIENTEDVFFSSLEALGYTIDDSQYDTVGYEAVSSDESIYINFYYYDGTFAIFFIEYNVYYGIEEHTYWPSEEIATFVNDASVVVPSADGSIFNVTILSESIEIRIPVADKTTAISGYETLLTSAGWTVVNHVAIDAGVEDSLIQITISSSTIDEQDTLIILIEHYVQPIPSGEFDFANENQLTTKDANTSIWTSGTVTMKIEKNGSQQDVGNGSFFADPLRAYTSQRITFTSSDKNISTITFVASSTTYASNLAASTWTGATAVASGVNVTVTATSATKTIVVVLTAQARLVSCTINFAN